MGQMTTVTWEIELWRSCNSVLLLPVASRLLIFTVNCGATGFQGYYRTGERGMGLWKVKTLQSSLFFPRFSWLFLMNTPWIVSSLCLISGVLKKLILIIFFQCSHCFYGREDFLILPFLLMSPPQDGFCVLFSYLSEVPAPWTQQFSNPWSPWDLFTTSSSKKPLRQSQIRQSLSLQPSQRGPALSTLPPWPHLLWLLFTLRWEEWSSWQLRAHLSVWNL